MATLAFAPVLSSAAQHHPSDDAAELSRLRQAVADLQKLLQAKDDFITIAAHELRNPMTPVLGIAQLALFNARKAEASCPPKVIVLLEKMQDAVQDFVKRATRLLDVNRIETGHLHLEPTATDLSDLLTTIAGRYALAANHAASLMELDVEPGIIGQFDPIAVEQIVENLLSNAIKFGLGKPIMLRLYRQGGAAWLEVQDQGIGMDATQQAIVFGRFEQVVTQFKNSGFGIGLWVTSRLVEVMQARIIISSAPGEGSTFTVVLPLNPPTQIGNT